MFDIKLINGEYLQNVSVWDGNDFIEDFPYIIEHKNEKFEIIDVISEETLYTNISYNENIEYICKAYKYKSI